LRKFDVSKVFQLFIIVFLFAFVDISILGSGQAFASGSSFNVPHVNDHFEKVQQGPAPTKETQINPAPSKNTKPSLWDRFTATCKDALNWYKKKLYDNRKWVENLEHRAWEKAKKGDWLAGILAIILLVQVVKTSFSVGVLRGLRDTVKGIGYMILHPIKTIEGIIEAFSHPVETGKAVWKFISESFKRDVINGDASSRAEWVGYVVGSLVGAKGVDKLGKLSKVAMLSKVSKVSRASKMGQLGRIGRGINAVQKGARKLRIPQTASKVRGSLSTLRKMILGNKVAASVITVVSITAGLIALDPEAVVQVFNKIIVAAEKNEVPLVSKLKPVGKEVSDCFTYQQQPQGYFANIQFPNCFHDEPQINHPRKPSGLRPGNPNFSYSVFEQDGKHYIRTSDGRTIWNKYYYRGSITKTTKQGNTYTVRYDEEGFPNFLPYAKKDKDGNPIIIQLPSDAIVGRSSDQTRFATILLKERYIKRYGDRWKEELRNEGFTEDQIESIDKGDGSIGRDKSAKLTWHHHQDTGKMVLVPYDLNNTFKHTGGHKIWGEQRVD
jgi:DNase/tRNase domain of colicin-like bacteriocin